MFRLKYIFLPANVCYFEKSVLYEKILVNVSKYALSFFLCMQTDKREKLWNDSITQTVMTNKIEKLEGTVSVKPLAAFITVFIRS